MTGHVSLVWRSSEPDGQNSKLSGGLAAVLWVPEKDSYLCGICGDLFLFWTILP